MRIDIEFDRDLINDFIKFRRETGADGRITSDCICSLPECWSETAKQEFDTYRKIAKKVELIKCLN